MRTAHKIWIFSSAALLTTLVGGGLAFAGTRRVVTHLDRLADGEFPSLVALEDLEINHQLAMRALNALLIERADADVHKRSYDRLARALDATEGARAAFSALPHAPEVLSSYEKVSAAYSAWRAGVEQAVERAHEQDRLRDPSQKAEPAALQAAADATFRAWQDAAKLERELTPSLTAATKLELAQVTSAKRSAAATADQTTQLEVVVIIVGAVFLCAFGAFLARSIRRTLDTLACESGRLTRAVAEGELSVRGDPSIVEAEFRDLIRGQNATLDALVRPIRLTAQYVDRIAHGDVPPPITDAYRGEFDAIKQNLNTCIAAVEALVKDAVMLSAAAIDGKLQTRADPSRHDGDFRKIVEGMNGTLDAVLNPIDEAAQVLDRLAGRDLRARVRGAYRGDHAKIAQAVNTTADALQGALRQVARTVEQVTLASTQIAASSQSVASGASEQASSLEETGSSLESMSSMTRHAADHAQQANALSGAAKNAAAEGTAATGEMTAAMARIKASAEGTSQILKDINEIAFQTNLLALNAAVEAARAGEAGRGFAVVAEEVRSLALRSKEAANRTEGLIRQSVSEAQSGEELARAVHAKLSEIGVGAGKAYDVMSEIVASAKEQAAGIAQITTAVGHMNQVTQQNAANAEESSSAAAELAHQARDLADIVGAFRLGDEDLAGAPPPDRWEPRQVQA